MAEVMLDPRLAALLPVIEEWKALRAYLQSLDKGADGQPVYWRAIKWIDDSVLRIEPHLHGHRWPLVWWRLGKVDFDLVYRDFHRADTDGYFFAPGGYAPERDKIIAWVDRINEAYKATRQAR